MKKMGVESNVIRQELLEIEEERNIQILYAAEYGRRARGYPSLDSRYDVRFIYRKNASERYLNEEYGQNLINWPSKYQNLDFTGLDIRHFLKLFANCHPAVYELFLSSINYRQKGSLRARIRSLMPEYFQPVKGSQYYFRYAEKKHIGFSNSKIQIGALFDMIRGLLACAWIREMNRIPPISPFEMLDLKILKEKKYAGFDAWFREEAERKKRRMEFDLSCSKELLAWLEMLFAQCSEWSRNAASYFPRFVRPKPEKLEHLLEELLKE